MPKCLRKRRLDKGFLLSVGEVTLRGIYRIKPKKQVKLRGLRDVWRRSRN